MTMQRRIYQGTPIGFEIERFADRMRTINANMLSMASANQPGEKGWFVLQVVAGREKAVENTLKEKGVFAYLPLIRGGKKVLRGRVVPCSDRPALPGYVMVSVVPSPAAFAGLSRAQSVEGILGGAERPHRVPDETMNRFKALLGEWIEADAEREVFSKGDWVQFDEGPFAGFKGYLTKIRKLVPVRGMKPIGIEGVVMLEVGGKQMPVTAPLALLAKI
ncbi:transcription termination/antitermination NusG family protein [Sinorhizobium fredii]